MLFVVVLDQAEVSVALPRKNKTVEMAQGKWAEMLIHTDRVTKARSASVRVPWLFALPGLMTFERKDTISGRQPCVHY